MKLLKRLSSNKGSSRRHNNHKTVPLLTDAAVYSDPDGYNDVKFAHSSTTFFVEEEASEAAAGSSSSSSNCHVSESSCCCCPTPTTVSPPEQHQSPCSKKTQKPAAPAASPSSVSSRRRRHHNNSPRQQQQASPTVVVVGSLSALSSSPSRRRSSHKSHNSLPRIRAIVSDQHQHPRRRRQSHQQVVEQPALDNKEESDSMDGFFPSSSDFFIPQHRGGSEDAPPPPSSPTAKRRSSSTKKDVPISSPRTKQQTANGASSLGTFLTDDSPGRKQKQHNKKANAVPKTTAAPKTPQKKKPKSAADKTTADAIKTPKKKKKTTATTTTTATGAGKKVIKKKTKVGASAETTTDDAAEKGGTTKTPKKTKKKAVEDEADKVTASSAAAAAASTPKKKKNAAIVAVAIGTKTPKKTKTKKAKEDTATALQTPKKKKNTNVKAANKDEEEEVTVEVTTAAAGGGPKTPQRKKVAIAATTKTPKKKKKVAVTKPTTTSTKVVTTTTTSNKETAATAEPVQQKKDPKKSAPAKTDSVDSLSFLQHDACFTEHQQQQKAKTQPILPATSEAATVNDDCSSSNNNNNNNKAASTASDNTKTTKPVESTKKAVSVTRSRFDDSSDADSNDDSSSDISGSSSSTIHDVPVISSSGEKAPEEVGATHKMTTSAKASDSTGDVVDEEKDQTTGLHQRGSTNSHKDRRHAVESSDDSSFISSDSSTSSDDGFQETKVKPPARKGGCSEPKGATVSSSSGSDDSSDVSSQTEALKEAVWISLSPTRNDESTPRVPAVLKELPTEKAVFRANDDSSSSDSSDNDTTSNKDSSHKQDAVTEATNTSVALPTEEGPSVMEIVIDKKDSDHKQETEETAPHPVKQLSANDDSSSSSESEHPWAGQSLLRYNNDSDNGEEKQETTPGPVKRLSLNDGSTSSSDSEHPWTDGQMVLRYKNDSDHKEEKPEIVPSPMKRLSLNDDSSSSSDSEHPWDGRMVPTYEEQRSALAGRRRPPTRIHSKSLENATSIKDRIRFLSLSKAESEVSPVKESMSPERAMKNNVDRRNSVCYLELQNLTTDTIGDLAASGSTDFASSAGELEKNKTKEAATSYNGQSQKHVASEDQSARDAVRPHRTSFSAKALSPAKAPRNFVPSSPVQEVARAKARRRHSSFLPDGGMNVMKHSTPQIEDIRQSALRAAKEIELEDECSEKSSELKAGKDVNGEHTLPYSRRAFESSANEPRRNSGPMLSSKSSPTNGGPDSPNRDKSATSRFEELRKIAMHAAREISEEEEAPNVASTGKNVTTTDYRSPALRRHSTMGLGGVSNTAFSKQNKDSASMLSNPSDPPNCSSCTLKPGKPTTCRFEKLRVDAMRAVQEIDEEDGIVEESEDPEKEKEEREPPKKICSKSLEQVCGLKDRMKAFSKSETSTKPELVAEADGPALTWENAAKAGMKPQQRRASEARSNNFDALRQHAMVVAREVEAPESTEATKPRSRFQRRASFDSAGLSQMRQQAGFQKEKVEEGSLGRGRNTDALVSPQRNSAQVRSDTNKPYAGLGAIIRPVNESVVNQKSSCALKEEVEISSAYYEKERGDQEKGFGSKTGDTESSQRQGEEDDGNEGDLKLQDVVEVDSSSSEDNSVSDSNAHTSYEYNGPQVYATYEEQRKEALRRAAPPMRAPSTSLANVTSLKDRMSFLGATSQSKEVKKPNPRFQRRASLDSSGISQLRQKAEFHAENGTQERKPGPGRNANALVTPQRDSAKVASTSKSVVPSEKKQGDGDDTLQSKQVLPVVDSSSSEDDSYSDGLCESYQYSGPQVYATYEEQRKEALRRCAPPQRATSKSLANVTSLKDRMAFLGGPENNAKSDLGPQEEEPGAELELLANTKAGSNPNSDQDAQIERELKGGLKKGTPESDDDSSESSSSDSDDSSQSNSNEMMDPLPTMRRRASIL